MKPRCPSSRLAQALRALQKEMVEKPANELRDTVLVIMQTNIKRNIDAAPDLKAVLQSASMAWEKGFRDGVCQMVEHFRKVQAPHRRSPDARLPGSISTTVPPPVAVA